MPAKECTVRRDGTVRSVASRPDVRGAGVGSGSCKVSNSVLLGFWMVLVGRLVVGSSLSELLGDHYRMVFDCRFEPATQRDERDKANDR